MFLQNLAIRTRLLLDDALRVARGCLSGGGGQHTPARQIELSELEDRVLLSAVPAAVMMPEQPAPAAELDQVAEMFDVAAQATDGSACNVIEVVRLQDDPQGDPNSGEFSYGGVESPSSHDSGCEVGADVREGEAPAEPQTIIAENTSAGASPSELHDETITSHELIFVDRGVDDYQQLVDDLLDERTDRDIAVVMLDDQHDGIEQITAALKEHTDLSAVHFVTHGADGAVKLGNTWLDTDSLHAYAGEIAGWGWALQTDADLLFYGCDLAASDNGQALVESLRSLTGADVAASDDDTGNANLGGDWQLEYSAGSIETDIAFSLQVQQQWIGLLGYEQLTEDWQASLTGIWETKDLSAYGVTDNAVVEIAIANTHGAIGQTGGVRAVGSALERKLTLDSAANGSNFTVMHVQADATGSIEQFASDTSIVFTLLGYWDGGAYVESFDAFSATAAATWEDHDLSAYGVGADEVAEIVLTNDHPSQSRQVGVRSNGSARERLVTLRDGEGSAYRTATMFVETDGAAAIEINSEQPSHPVFFLVGHWASAPGTYHEAFDDLGGPSSSGVWEDKDLSGFGVSAGGVVELLAANEYAVTKNMMGVRENASSIDRFLEIDAAVGGDSSAARMHVTADPSSTIEWYHEDIADPHSFHLTGYWSGVVDFNQAPMIANLAGDTLPYSEGSGDLLIEQGGDAAVIDVDSPDFDTGNLTVSIAAGGDAAEDVLSIRDEGADPGQIGFSGGNVTFGGTLVGTAAGGSGGADLVVSLNGNATPIAVTALVKNITYENTDTANPTVGARTVRFTVNDGDGGTSADYDATVTVSGVNDDPSNAGGLPIDVVVDEDVATDIDLSLIDLADVDAGSGDLTLTLSTSTGGTLSASDSGGVTAGGSGTGTFTLTGTLANLNSYLDDPTKIEYLGPLNVNGNDADTIAVQITDNGSTGAGGGNISLGSVNVDITPVNDPPVEAGIEGVPLAYTENDPATAITSTITVGDVDDTNIEMATVQITGNYQNGQDLLAFTDLGPITGNWNAVTGTMMLSGSDTLANYQAALRTVTYQNTSNDPATLARTVSFMISDGDDASNMLMRDINVSAVNEPGVLAGIEAGALSCTENDAATPITATLTVSDGDDSIIAGATVQITGNYQDGQDVLDFIDLGPITGSWDAATGTMTLSGSDTLANYQAALRTVTYQNTSDDPSTLVRTVSFTVNDGDDPSNTLMRDINVSAVNDPSVLAGIEAGALSYTENDPATPITTTLTVNDVDDVNIENATVQITGNYQDGQDLLAFTDTPSITGVWDAVTGTLTLTGTDTLANYEAALRNVAYENTSDVPSTLTRTVSFTVDDGADPSNIETRDINLTAVNDDPVADVGGPYAIDEGGSVLLDASASSDLEGDPLTYSWDMDDDAVFGDVTGVSPTLTWAQLQSFGIDDDGVYDISVEVDDGNGGTDVDSTTISVANVAPTLSITGAATVNEDDPYTLNLSASDPGDDTISGWTINWGDGTIETIAGNPASVNHAYNAGGFTFNILASATDEDGTFLQNELLVASSNSDSMMKYGTDGGFLLEFATPGGSDYPVDPIIGPDGNLYVSGWNSDDVLRYNPTTGAFIDEFVTAGSGGLDSAAGLAFGPDGDLYVASRKTGEVLRFDGTTGAFIDVFANLSSIAGGVEEPEGLTFGPDGDLYVSDYKLGAVYKFDGRTGEFDSVIVSAGSGGLSRAEDLVFGPDGNLYVANDTGKNVLRYNGTTGAFIDNFVAAGSGGLKETQGLSFGPDGNLYVGSYGTDSVLRYDGTTGAFIDAYVNPGSGGLDETCYFDFIPGQQVYVTPVNDAPVNSVPGPQVTGEDTPLMFNAAGGNLISISDVDAGTVEVTLNGSNGLITLSGAAGLSFSTGDGTADASMTFTGTIAKINTSLDGLTFDPTPEFSGAASLQVITDDQGNTGSGGPLTDDDTIAITVNPVNDAPTLTATGDDLTFTEGGPAVGLYSSSSVDVVEPGDVVEKLTLTVAGLQNGADEILVVDGTNVTLTDLNSVTTGANGYDVNVSVAAGTATVTITKAGNYTAAAAETLVDGLTYENTSDDPLGANRTAKLTLIKDDGGTANGGDDDTVLNIVSTVTLTAVNDAPTLTATGDDPAYTEDAAAAGLFSSTSIDLVESGDLVDTLTLTVAGLQNGADEILVVDGTDVVLTHLNSVTTGANSYDVNVSVAGSTATVTITKAGNYTAAAAETLVDGLAYENTNDDPTDGSTRTATLTLIEDDGGTASGGDDDTVLNIVSTVTLTAVNDAPTLTTSADNPTFTEGGAAVGLYSSISVDVVEPGDLVETLTLTVAGLQNGANEILVVDGTDVALTHLNSVTTGANSYDVNVSVAGGTATVTITKAGNYTAAAAETLVDGLAYENTSDDPLGANRTATLTLIKDDGGTASGGDDNTVLNIASTVTLMPVNDAPSLTANGDDPTFTEGATAAGLYSSTSIDLVESADLVDTLTLTVAGLQNGADEILVVDGTIVALTHLNSVTTGANSYDVDVSVAGGTATVTITKPGNYTAAAAQTLVDGLAYENTSDDPLGADRTATLTLIKDDGGTASGGDDNTVLNIASTITLTAVNDPPVNSVPGPQATNEDTPLVFDAGGGNLISIGDVDVGGNPVEVTLTATNGTITLGGLMRRGGEYQVNTTTTGDQREPEVATDANGNYVVAWEGKGDQAGQVDDKGVFFQRYNSSGVAQGSETLVNTTTAGDQKRPAVAMDADGNFVVAWVGVDSNHTGVFFQRYNSAGVAQGVETLVNTTTTEDQQSVAIDMDADGNFVVVWSGKGLQSGQHDSKGVFFQRYNASGVAQGGETLVNTTTPGDQGEPEVAMDADGDFVVVWHGSGEQFGQVDGAGVFFQRFNASGVAQGSETLVNTTTANVQNSADVAIDADGNFVIAWESTDQDHPDGKKGVYAQRYDSGGVAQGGEFLVNTTTPDEQHDPDIAMDSAGNFAISWHSHGQDNPSGSKGVHVRHYASNGVAQGDESLVNTTTAGDQTRAAVAMDSAGNFVVAWDSHGQDNPDGSVGIYAQRYGRPTFLVGDGVADTTMTFTGTVDDINDALVGLSFDPSPNFNGAASLQIITDDLGSSGSGGLLIDDDTIAITVNPVNDAPTLTATGDDPMFTEGGAAASLYSGTSIDLADSGDLVDTLTLTVAGLQNGADEILVVDGTGVALTHLKSVTTGANSYDVDVSVAAGTATVTITKAGDYTAASAETLVDGLAYENTNHDPTDGSARTATLTLIKDDGGTAGGGDDDTVLSIGSTVTLTAVNDAPIVTATGDDPTFVEAGAAAGLYSSTSIDLVESGDRVDTLTLTVAGLQNGADEILVVDGTNVVLTHLNSVTTGANSYDVNVSVAGGTATVTITKAGNYTAAAAQTLVDGLAYKNTNDDPTDGSNRTATLTWIKDDGGTALGGDDNTNSSIASTVTLTASNDPPTLTATAVNPGFTEGAAAVGLYSGTNIDLVESADLVDTLTLTVAGLQNGVDEILVVDGTNVALTHLNSVTTGANSYDVDVSVAAGTATVIITKAGNYMAAAAQTLVDGLAYENTSDEATNGSTRTATLTWITDDGGTAAGGDDETVLSIASTVSLTAFNDPPTLTATGDDPAFIEDAAPAGLYNSTSIDLVEPGDLVDTLTLTVAGLQNGADEILVVDGTDVALTSGNSVTTGANSYEVDVFVAGSTATVTISKAGHYTAAEAETLVDSLAYKNTNDDLTDASTRSATLTLIKDNGGTALGGDDDTVLAIGSTVTLTAVNDAPVNAIPGAQDANEDLPLVFDTGGGNLISISDVDAGGNIVQVALQAIEGLITLGDTAGLSFTVGDGSDDPNMVFTGTIANINEALDGLTFDPSSDFHGAASLQITTNDLGNMGAGGPRSDDDTMLITVAPVNDAPLLDNTGTMTLTDISEDDPAPTGDAVSAVIANAGGDRISDIDVGSVEGIAVIGVDDTNGTWQYNSGGGWTAFGAVTDSSAVLLDPTAKIRFLPGLNYNGPSGSITFRAWDQSDGNPSGSTGIDASVNGGITAYSTATEVASLNVHAVNDAPTLADTVVTLNSVTEDTGAPLGAVGTRIRDFADLNPPAGGQDNLADVDLGSLAGVAIVGADTTNGTWWYATDDGTIWNPLGAVSAASSRVLAADADTRIYFQPDPDFEGTIPGALTFRAWDRTDGNPNGTAGVDTTISGGTNAYSTATDGAETTVIGVNDAPVLDNSGVMTLTDVDEDDAGATGDTVSAIIASAGGDRITEIDIASVEGIAVIGVDDINGTWQYDAGGGWTSFGAVADDSAVLLDFTARIRFFPALNYNGPSGSITFRAWDQTDGNSSGDTGVDVSTNGGITAYSLVSEVASLNVNPVNDAPELDLDADNSSGQPGSGYATTFTEDGGSVVVADDDASLADVDDTTLESLTVTITNLWDGAAESLVADTSGTSITAAYNPVTGVLTLSGTDTKARYQQVLRTVEYNNTSQAPNTADRILHVVANDGSADSHLGVVTVDVAAQNDAPANAVPGPQVTAEDTPLVFSAAGGNPISISDIDAGNNLVIVTLTATNGKLTLGDTADLVFGTGDGVHDPTMTFVGTLAEINAALDGMKFDPTPDYHGPATIQITVDDQGNIGIDGVKVDVDTIDITVTPTNDAPVAHPDTYTVFPGNILDVSGPGLLAGDLDVDGDPLTAVLVDGPMHGTLALLPNGSLTYLPDNGFYGTDTFTYWAHDGSVGSNMATVTITVQAAGSLPVEPPLDEPPTDDVTPPEEETGEEEADDLTPIDAGNLPQLNPGSKLNSDPKRNPGPTPELVAADLTGVAASQPPGVVDDYSFDVTSLPTDGANRSDKTRPQEGSLSAAAEQGAADDRPSDVGSSEFAYLAQPGGLWDDLDQIDEDMKSGLHFRDIVVGTAAVTSLSLTVGYVAWFLRGGLLLTSLLVNIPAWRSIDPLVVLESVDEEDLRRHGQGGETLEDIIDNEGGAGAGREEEI